MVLFIVSLDDHQFRVLETLFLEEYLPRVYPHALYSGFNVASHPPSPVNMRDHEDRVLEEEYN